MGRRWWRAWGVGVKASILSLSFIEPGKVVTLANLGPVLACSWMIGQPPKSSVHRLHVLIALIFTPLLAGKSRNILQVIVRTWRQPECRLHSSASASAINLSSE